MNNAQIVRAWKDEAYRAALTPAQQAALPPNPAGSSFRELSDDALAAVVGASDLQDVIASRTSGGHVCTATTECPILSFCC